MEVDEEDVEEEVEEMAMDENSTVQVDVDVFYKGWVIWWGTWVVVPRITHLHLCMSEVWKEFSNECEMWMIE